MATQISSIVNALTVDLIPKIVQMFAAWINDVTGFSDFIAKIFGL